MAPNDALRGVRGQGGPTGPVYPQGLSTEEMNRVRAGRYVPPDPNQSAPTQTPGLPQLGAQQPGASTVAGNAGATVTAQGVSNTGGMTVPTYTPQGMEWKAPDLSAYDTQFQESLAASRSNIANQFQRALEDINTQEGIANEVVGTLPGRYKDIWGNAQERTGEAAGRATTALERSGLGGMLSQEELMAPQMQALQGGQAAYEASVPLTQLGTQELFTRQKGALAQARMGAEEPLHEATRQWLATRSGQEMQSVLAENSFNLDEAQRQDAAAMANITNQMQESQFGRRLTSEEKRFNAEQAAQTARANADRAAENARFNAGQKQQMNLAQLGGETIPWKDKIKFQTDEDIRKAKALQGDPEAVQVAKETLTSFGTKQVGFQKGQALYVTGGADAIKQSPSYKNLASAMAKKYKDGVPPEKAQEAREFILKEARGKPWDRSVSLILFDWGVDDTQMGPASLLPNTGSGSSTKKPGPLTNVSKDWNSISYGSPGA